MDISNQYTANLINSGEHIMASFMSIIMAKISSLGYPKAILDMLYTLHAITDAQGKKVYISADIALILNQIILLETEKNVAAPVVPAVMKESNIIVRKDASESSIPPHNVDTCKNKNCVECDEYQNKILSGAAPVSVASTEQLTHNASTCNIELCEQCGVISYTEATKSIQIELSKVTSIRVELFQNVGPKIVKEVHLPANASSEERDEKMMVFVADLPIYAGMIGGNFKVVWSAGNILEDKIQSDNVEGTISFLLNLFDSEKNNIKAIENRN